MCVVFRLQCAPACVCVCVCVEVCVAMAFCSNFIMCCTDEEEIVCPIVIRNVICLEKASKHFVARICQAILLSLALLVWLSRAFSFLSTFFQHLILRGFYTLCLAGFK